MMGHNGCMGSCVGGSRTLALVQLPSVYMVVVGVTPHPICLPRHATIMADHYLLAFHVPDHMVVMSLVSPTHWKGSGHRIT